MRNDPAERPRKKMYPDTQIPQVTSCVVPSSMGPFRNLAPISHNPTAVTMMSTYVADHSDQRIYSIVIGFHDSAPYVR